MKFKNRYGDEYWFSAVDDNTVKIEGALKYWRMGGKEGAEGIDDTDLGFVDPSGGPFISAGYEVDGRRVVRISTDEQGIFLTLE